MLFNIIVVMAGGAIGAVMRYVAVIWLHPAKIGTIPWATLAVNLAGSLVLGLLVAVFIKADTAQAWRLFLAVGVLGSFTTFSTFSLETADLLRQGFYFNALIYVLLSNAGGIALAAAGYYLIAGAKG